MRKFLLLIITIILLLPTVAQAQTNSSCGTLSTADCTIMTDSQAAMANLKSATLDLRLTLHVQNLPEGDLEVLAIGGGAYQVDVPAWNNRLAFSNGQAFASYLAGYLHDVGASINLTFSMQSGSDVEAAALQMRLADSVVYFNMSGLRALFGDLSAYGWAGIDLEGLLRLMLDQDPHVFDDYLKGTGVAGVNPVDTSPWTSVSRLKSVEPGIAIFETRLKLSDMLTDPAVDAAYRQQLEQMQSRSDAEMTLLLLQMIVGDSEVVVQQRIRLSDHYLETLDLTYELDLDRFSQKMLFPDAETTQPLHIDFGYHVQYNHFNAAPPITAPNDVAQIFDYDTLRRLMIGSGAPL